jgi:uncharacterized phage-associated protein
MHSKEQIDKIGNTVVYLASNIDKISKTKALKLLYILDETLIKTTGIPFLNLEYKVWKFGPVSNDLFVEFSSSPSLLKNFIKLATTPDGHRYIKPKVAFNDDEFTDIEVELLETVVAKYKDATAKALVKITHRKHSPWRNAAERHKVLSLLENEEISVTEIKVDMKELISHDERKLSLYEHYQKEQR